MKKFLLLITLGLALCGSAQAAVVRLAPEVSFPTAGNKSATLKSLRGQAVVLLVAESPNQRAFKKQLRYLEEIFQQFASKQVVFIAALKAPDGPVKSNIPFALANNPAAVSAAYGSQSPFRLVIIGKDGNIDYQTDKVCTGERVRDVIQNSFAVQEPGRR